MGFVLDLDKKYIVLPYVFNAEPREVGFYKENGEIITSLLLEYNDKPEDWVYLSSSLFREKRIYIEGDDVLKALIRCEDEKKGEGNHFTFHYAPSFGWVNDPNGLHYNNGVYHLYYQTNPVSKKWNNMSWGHAVSTNLVSFAEQDPVFLPKDDSWVIFSGSALDGEFAYTVANIKGERRFYQERRFSSDGFVFGECESIIPNHVGDERDPRLFMYKGRKYLLLWLKDNTFSLYIDENGRYEEVNTFLAQGAWECPDIYILGDRMFFSSADGFYYECEIAEDGLRIIGERKEMFLTKIPYASQSFTGLDETYMISWLRIETPHLRTTGAMSMVRKVGLDGGDITLSPNEDLLSHFEEKGSYRNQYSSEHEALRLVTKGSFKGDIGGTAVSFDKENGVLKYGKEEVKFKGKTEELDIYLDHEIVEISDKKYRELAVFEIKAENDYHRGVRITSSDLDIKEFIWR